MTKLIGIVGSNSSNSTNRKFLKYIQSHYANKAEIELVEIKGLPIYNKPNDGLVPEYALEISEKIENADGVIIATPEYDHAPSAALLNALAWLSHKVHPFADKPVMIVGASYGTLGSSRAQGQLRQILDSPELRARIMPSSEYLLSHSLQAFDQHGNLVKDEDIRKLDGIFEDFLVFIHIVNKLVNEAPAIKRELETLDWKKL